MGVRGEDAGSVRIADMDATEDEVLAAPSAASRRVTRASSERGIRCAMPPTTAERYAVVSCHVERPLDDRVWAAFAALQERRPGGFAIAALLRPPDAEAGRRTTSSGSSVRARPRRAAHSGTTRTGRARRTHDRRVETRRGVCAARAPGCAERGVAPTLFCGGGWYTDRAVAAACATLGLRRLHAATSPARRTSKTGRWAELASPAWIGLGRAASSAPSRRRTASATWRARSSARACRRRVHTYFHDTDLVDRRRRVADRGVLTMLGRRRPATDLDVVAASAREQAPLVAWAEVARGEAADARA